MSIKGSRLGLLVAVTSFIAVGVFTFQCKRNDTVANVPDEVDFNFDVRPILVQNCYLCHGPDPSSRKADLRLDTFEGATALLREGNMHAIVPGDPDESEVIRRVMSKDTDVMMPPPESNLKLTPYDIEVLKKWIDQGAQWKKHWAFIPPKINEPKHIKTSANEIDDFVQKKLEENNLKPVAQANKPSLIRRVSYILTGLPPTTDQIEEFLSDSGEDAYEKMVDQYLRSSGFGERWARHWLDVVRYAETKGHEFDYEITGAWRYRDYLIRAFNDDVPYDQLVKEHVAGDLMENVRWNPDNGINESQIGTAFYALGEGTHSPVDIRKDEADRIDNMIDVTNKAFQGLTVSCARCHDHKFDPIPTADYYAMYGVMESSRFSPKPANLTYEKMENLKELENLKIALEKMITQNVPSLSSSGQKINETNSAKHYEMIGDFRGKTLDGWKSDGIAFGKQTTLGSPVFDNSGNTILKYANGKASSRHLSTGIFGAIRSENFKITHDFVGVRALGDSSTVRVVIDNFQLIQYPIYGGLEHKINSKKWKNVTFDLSAWKGHKAYIEILSGIYEAHAYRMPQDAYIEVEYAITFDKEWPIQIGSKYKQDIEKVTRMNDLLAQGKIPKQLNNLRTLRQEQNRLIATLRDTSFFVGIEEGFGINSPVFERGSHKNELETPIQRGFLSAVTDNHKFKTEGSGRMDLAKAILDPENPLTSRVMVNRIWHHLFGRGLVPTVDNFGLQGKLPSHPELLDYLAIKFQKEGWSIKTMIKYIVMSNTFRRAVTAGEDATVFDPDNLLLSHFPVRRIEAEAIRDGLLAASGQLNDTMYGEPVPIYLTPFMTGRGKPAQSGPLDGDGRRSIYQSVRRNFMEAMMLTFDRPIPFSTFGKRNVTNVPAQSLILMNDPFVIEQAKKLAEQVLEQKALSKEEKIDYIYVRALSRRPGEEEVKNASEFLQLLAQSYELSAEEAMESVNVWKDYCHSVFNLKEFIYLI